MVMLLIHLTKQTLLFYTGLLRLMFTVFWTIHCTLELNIAIYLLLKLVWVRVEVTAPFLILLLKNAKYCYDEIRNSLCLALKEGFSVMTE